MIPHPRKKRHFFPVGSAKAAETTYKLLAKDTIQVVVVLRQQRHSEAVHCNSQPSIFYMWGGSEACQGGQEG